MSTSTKTSAPRTAARRGLNQSPQSLDRALAAEVEHDDAKVAEVVAMYGRTVVDARHVGQVSSRRRGAPKWLVLGGAMALGGLGLFAYDAAQDWQTWQAAKVEAAEQGLPEPEKPGLGLGGLGIGLLFFGLIPGVVGLTRMRDRGQRRYTIGEGNDADLTTCGDGLPEPGGYALVRTLEDGRYALDFTPAMEGAITLGDRSYSLAAVASSGMAAPNDGRYRYVMPDDATAAVKLGENTFHVRTVPRGKVVAGRGEVDVPFLAYAAGTGLVAAALLSLASMIPDASMAFELDDAAGESRFVSYMAMPDEPKPEPVVVEQVDDGEQPSEGAAGQRAMGNEGAAGKPSSKSQKGLMAVKGPASAIPNVGRNFDPNQAIYDNSILGVLAQEQGHFLANPYGGAFTVGNDDSDVWGTLDGNEVGEAWGVGGMGLVGTGRGGGGLGENTVGLSYTGLIGRGTCHGSGCGEGGAYTHDSGARFGPKAKKGPPTVRGAKMEITGALDKDLIRRVIRSHINEVRACYNQGLARNPSLSGRVEVSFSIGGTGRVMTSGIGESSVKDKQVDACIAKAVKRWKFPRPRNGGNVMVSYPFKLSPG